ncbi:bifunctional DNA primase/polymerase [Corticibacterium sp. UT-5YL-CI-8]|nr:bifunctional DNA primase/polymerase [Tianweitania sp. UT-5YL-CI-8]
MQPDPMLSTALSFAAQGWPVFPCRPADAFDPATGEVLPEKAPLISNGFRGATLNERVIGELWKRNPGSLVGVPTGERINAWVLDIDVKTNGTNGFEWLEAMEDTHGALPDTARVMTANGGMHIFFTYAEGVRNRGGLGSGIDVRGEGGFVVAAGSAMADGRTYEWVDDTGPADIKPAPQWLLDLVLPQVHQPTRHDYTYASGTNDAYVEGAVRAELSRLAHTGQGQRGYQLNASAFSLGTLVGSAALSRDEAERGLYDAAWANGLVATDGERETWAKIRRGLDAGQKQPREIPERQAQNDNTRLVDISRMIENGLRKAAAAETDPEPETSAPAEVSEKTIQTSDIRPPQPTEPQPISATPFNWIDPKTLPRREFAFGSHYIRKYVSVTVAPGGLGKTANSIVDSLAMTSGRSLAGTKPPNRLKVWLFNAEDPRDELERRIMAACIHYKLKPADIAGHLFLDTGREQELVIAIDDKKAGVRIQQPIVEAVVQQIQENAIDVMIVDPFVSTHSVNENDNGAIDKVAKLWAQIADRTNCSIDIVHHLRKVSDREATVEDARGAVSLIGAARSVRVLNRMSDEQAAQAGIAGEERFGFFSVTYGKSNLTPLSHRLDWRRLESVPLGNGRGLSKPQDHAPVVTEWRWPSAEEVAGNLSADQIEAIRVAVNNSDFKESPRAKNWVGLAVAYALGLDVEDDPQRKKAAVVVKALIKEGVLVKKEEKDPIRRESAVFVRAA